MDGALCAALSCPNERTDFLARRAVPQIENVVVVVAVVGDISRATVSGV